MWGIAKSARLVYSSLATKVAVNGIEVPIPSVLARSTDEPSPGIFTSLDAGFDVNVFVHNADETDHVARMYPWSSFRGRYNIAVWAWELESFPKKWIANAYPYDEIWTPSAFVGDAVRRALRRSPATAHIPVKVMPYGNDRDTEDAGALPDRRAFGWADDCFVFLLTFDFASIIARKDPYNAIRAFKLAFAPDDTTVRLVVKSMGGSWEELHNLAAELKGWTNIEASLQLHCFSFATIVTPHLSRFHIAFFPFGFVTSHFFHSSPQFHEQSISKAISAEQLAIMRISVDCYVSLHRSEGYGLNILENLLHGTPVIATKYGGNMEFMQHLEAPILDAFGADFELVQLERDHGPYWKGATWAKAKTQHAATLMRFARDHPALVKSYARNASAWLQTSVFSSTGTGGRMAERLQLISSRTPSALEAKGIRSDSHYYEWPQQSVTCYWLKNPDLTAALTTYEQVNAHFKQAKARGEQRLASCEWLSRGVITSADAFLRGEAGSMNGPRLEHKLDKWNGEKYMDRARAETLVRSLYKRILLREADPSGLEHYVNALQRARPGQERHQLELLEHTMRRSEEYVTKIKLRDTARLKTFEEMETELKEPGSPYRCATHHGVAS